MKAPKSKKAALAKPKHAERSTQSSISQSWKKAAHRSRASATSTPTPSTPALSRHASVEDVEDDEPTSVGRTLDADGDSIMELSDGEGGGTQGNGAKAMSTSSDDDDILVDEEEVQLSTSCDPDFLKISI